MLAYKGIVALNIYVKPALSEKDTNLNDLEISLHVNQHIRALQKGYFVHFGEQCTFCSSHLASLDLFLQAVWNNPKKEIGALKEESFTDVVVSRPKLCMWDQFIIRNNVHMWTYTRICGLQNESCPASYKLSQSPLKLFTEIFALWLCESLVF